MAIPDGHTTVSAVVPLLLRDELRDAAAARGISVSQLIAGWLIAGAIDPLTTDSETRSVRSNRRELFVSLPKDFTDHAGLSKGDRITLAYGHRSIIMTK